jgi:hypothetical protein
MASPCHQNLLKKSDPGPRQTIADPGKTHQTVKKWTAERESKENEAQERIEEQMRDEQAKEKQERSDIKAKEKEERKNKRIADKEVRNLETSSTSLPRRKHSVALIILLQANTPKNMNSNQITEYKTTSRIKKGNSENGMNNAFWHKTVLPNGKLDVHFAGHGTPTEAAARALTAHSSTSACCAKPARTRRKIAGPSREQVQHHPTQNRPNLSPLKKQKI